jgi:hypothetical protein
MGMSDNVFDIGSHRPLESLIKELCSLKECRRLGFVFEDESKIMSLSVAGFGPSTVREGPRHYPRGGSVRRWLSVRSR